MSETTLTVVLLHPDDAPGQARSAMAAQVLPACDAKFKRGVRRVKVTVEDVEDDRSLKQNAFYWSFVLKQISAQAVINGIGSDENGWHYYMKKRLLGYRVFKQRVPGSKRPAIRRELRSTTKLKVKAMSEYMEKVMAAAATEFGVTFDPGKRWEDWR